MSYARRHSINVCPGNRVRYRSGFVEGRVCALREFPACAGMIRTCCLLTGLRPRVPRMRGDDPEDPTNFANEVTSSPHARG